MRKKKLMALALAGALGLSALAGCGNEEKPSNTPDTGKEENQDQNQGEEQKEENQGGDSNGEVVTLKWVTVGNGMPDNYEAWLAQVNPYLEEKIGVNVDMEIVPWSDWDNRRSMIANSGEAFDILFTDQGRYSGEVTTGIFLELSDLLPTAAPELFNFIPEDYWTAASSKGGIYAVPTYKDSSVTNYFVWDTAVAEKYNIDYKNITDMSSLYDALKTIKEGEGGSPYYMSKNGANFLAMKYDDLGTGLPALGVKYEDSSKTVFNPLEDPELVDNLKIVHQMYKDGIINGDAPQADDTNGYRTFFVAQGWSGAAKTNWGPNNGIENCEAIQYGTTYLSNSTVRGSLNGISVNSKNPEKALALLQLVNTDPQVRDWYFYGVQGDNWDYENGKVKKLKDDPWAMAGYTQGTFFTVTPEVVSEDDPWAEVIALNENATPSVLLGFDMDTSSVETELANCRNVIEKYKAELWTGAQDPEVLIPKIISELDAAGYQTILETAQEQVSSWQ